MGKVQIPVLGRLRHAVSMKYQVDNIFTRLYVVTENQFQIVKKEEIGSLKRAFRNCSAYRPQQLEELALEEIKKALKFTFRNFEVTTKVEKIKDNDYRLIIAGVVYSDDGIDKCNINELVSYDGSSFTRLVNDINKDPK